MAAEGSREIPKAYRESSLPCIDTKGPKKENEAVKSARKGSTASQRGRGGRIRNMIKLRRGSKKSTNDDSSEERPPNSVIVPDTPLEMSGITQAPISPVSHRHAISVDGYDSIATAGGSSINSVAPERPSNQSLVTSQTIEEYRETQKRQQSALGIKHAKRFMKESSRFVQLDTEQIERIQIMHDQFAEGSAFTFNYNTLLLVASVLAGLGLISNSSTTVIASMLVSPIMGPVVGIAYGLTIHDYKLCKKAHLNFYLSLLFCVGIGVCLGAICGPFEISEAWPTDEMLARGSLQAFLVAIPVAFFSGLGVAVSLLDSQTNSLVGVAISASLLPPAVNAGVLWVTWAFYQDYDHSLNVGANGHIDTRIQQYSGDDFRNAGFISLCITLVNVVLIIVASVFMFRLKEVSIVLLPCWVLVGVDFFYFKLASYSCVSRPLIRTGASC